MAAASVDTIGNSLETRLAVNMMAHAREHLLRETKQRIQLMRLQNQGNTPSKKRCSFQYHLLETKNCGWISPIMRDILTQLLDMMFDQA